MRNRYKTSVYIADNLIRSAIIASIGKDSDVVYKIENIVWEKFCKSHPKWSNDRLDEQWINVLKPEIARRVEIISVEIIRKVIL